MTERRFKTSPIFCGQQAFWSPLMMGEVIEFSQQVFEQKPSIDHLQELGGKEIEETRSYWSRNLKFVVHVYAYWAKRMGGSKQLKNRYTI